MSGFLPGNQAQAQPRELNVYSARHYNTDKEFYDRFTKATGIKVNLLESSGDALLSRQALGIKPPADVIILVDASRLARAAETGIFRSISSPELRAKVPSHLRDPENRWFGLTRRFRVPVVNPDMVDPDTITSYEDLANSALDGKLCLRNSKSPYNQSLVAYQLERMGEVKTSAWVQAMVDDLAQPFFSSDGDQIRAVGRGDCGVAVVNTYYLGQRQGGDKGPEDKALADKVVIAWPEKVHVNISGAGVTANSPNPEAAQQFIEFLADESADYAKANREYPVRGTGSDPVLQAWGSFNEDNVSAATLGRNNASALRLMEANGWSQ
ncbi:MAG: extracellular solute-binding protein [Synechococcus sp. SB0673_bin_10]|nr:extracellular solute-binding protein [Synechococcus sp. SB0668_bin_13]MXX08929.1 extracellular solute-binding protein [Synechococcus sp. SB0667_bin_8]MYF20166.1 extracellular solute-binding protein [Synechococcus sp. SB0677_bin_5]MYI71447.1 extracellular solute-binding protein [Synechococcus sp. SB0673_bin_10]MYK86537.1 extracellular solute-binding protein [Synechococcus sp. SB0669_bin_7]